MATGTKLKGTHVPYGENVIIRTLEDKVPQDVVVFRSSTSQKSEQDTRPELQGLLTPDTSPPSAPVSLTAHPASLWGRDQHDSDDVLRGGALGPNLGVHNSAQNNSTSCQERDFQEERCDEIHQEEMCQRGQDAQSIVEPCHHESEVEDNASAKAGQDKGTHCKHMDQLRQPRLAFSGSFTEEGGVLKNPDTDVVLTVPAGAVPPGQTVNVSVNIHTDLMNYTKWVPSESASIIGPVVECEMDRKMTFQKQVTLSIPLCITPEKSSDVKVLCSHGDIFQDISSDNDIGYKIEENILQIRTTHFTKFLVEGKVVAINRILLTLAARFSTGSCGKLELRPMAHVTCLTAKEFVKDRKLSYHEDMDIIDSQAVLLPERGRQLDFPEILVKVRVEEDSAWKIVDSENNDAKSCCLEKRINGMDVLNTVNSESRALKNFQLESTGIVKQAECKMIITFKYKEDGIEPGVYTFPVTYPKDINHTDSKAESEEMVDKLRKRAGSNGYTVDTENELRAATLADCMEKELGARKDILVGTSGWGVHAASSNFRAKITALNILQDFSIQEIEAAKTRSAAADMLIDHLLTCARAGLVRFAWLLMDVGQGHQLPESITEEVKGWLSGYTRKQIMEDIK